MKSLSSVRRKEYLNPGTPKFVEGKVGSSIYLDVSEDGRLEDPVWTFNGKHIDKKLYYHNGLELRNAEFSQSGSYECIAKYGARYAFDVKVYDYMSGDQFLGIRTHFPGSEIKKKKSGSRVKSSYPRSKTKTQTVSYRDGKIDEYNMNRNPRGIVCIVVIDEFDFLPSLNGIEDDIDNCKETFAYLHFDVRICIHKTEKKILGFIENIANEDHSNYDCSVLYISSHGGDGFVCCKDFETEYLRQRKLNETSFNKANSTKSTEIFKEGKMSVDKIPKGYILFDTVLDLFVRSNTLLKKPKLFFWDCCRLPDQNIVTPTPQAPIRPFKSHEQMQEHYTDILIGYASLLGREAFLGSSGSAYTEILTNCLKNLSATESVADVMNEVNVCMRKNKSDDQQLSSHISYLEKKLVMRSIPDKEKEVQRYLEKRREIRRNMFLEKERDLLKEQLKKTHNDLLKKEIGIVHLEKEILGLEQKQKTEEVKRQQEREKHKKKERELQSKITQYEIEKEKCVCM